MIKAKKDLGQNFLVDQVALNKIFELINPKNTDHFLEIGPGKGALTKVLANSTGRLDAVELDRDLLLSLELINSEKLYIHNENILDFKISDILGNKKLRIVPIIFVITIFLMIWAELAIGVFGSPIAGS